MRRLIPVLPVGVIALGVLALATPALALTVTAAPNRDQAAHLQQQRGSTANVDLRDTLAGGGRPQAGADLTSRQGSNDQTQTFSFGNVTTTVTTSRQDYRQDFDTPRSRLDLLPPQYTQRRR
ncbi:hypothetical protein [Phenylobacterium sp.]|uniref:hypothetical protein n=1 Tax=Phenylobacterium sp. TaxID=1871053 RepID=UPI0025E7D7E5|nr:hypothetical protein [Phenylobacterium sp.]